MSSDERVYHSYLLRLWRAADHKKPLWRASLEEPVTGKRMGFTGLEALFTFLRNTCGPVAENETGDESPTSSYPQPPLDPIPSTFFPPEEVSE